MHLSHAGEQHSSQRALVIHPLLPLILGLVDSSHLLLHLVNGLLLFLETVSSSLDSISDKFKLLIREVTLLALFLQVFFSFPFHLFLLLLLVLCLLLLLSEGAFATFLRVLIFLDDFVDHVAHGWFLVFLLVLGPGLHDGVLQLNHELILLHLLDILVLIVVVEDVVECKRVLRLNLFMFNLGKGSLHVVLFVTDLRQLFDREDKDGDRCCALEVSVSFISEHEGSVVDDGTFAQAFDDKFLLLDIAII